MGANIVGPQHGFPLRRMTKKDIFVLTCIHDTIILIQDMKRKSSLNKIYRLRKIWEQTADILDEMLISESLMIGTLSEVLRTCGKPNCHCTKKPCHRHWTLLTTFEGKRRCQVIRKKDVENVQKKVECYRRFRNLLKQIKCLDLQRYALLKELLEERNELYK